jgi:ferredoxin--NADP+ reductase
MSIGAYDLVVIGGNSAGLTVAVQAQQAGLRLVRILECGSTVAFPELLGQHHLDVGYGEAVVGIDLVGDNVAITTDRLVYLARACVITQRSAPGDWVPPNATVSERVLVDRLPQFCDDEDVLVAGRSDQAAELTAALAAAGARPVLAGMGLNSSELTPVAADAIQRLEKDRRATILYRSSPQQITEEPGLSPMAFFGDRRTPDLEFDYVVFASGSPTIGPVDVGLSDAAAASERVVFVGEAPTAAPAELYAPLGELRERLGTAVPELLAAPAPVATRPPADPARIEELREEHYNAVITLFEPTHSDLWVLRVKPDRGETSHLPGQYASLGLGFWEERIDDATDPSLDEKWEKLIRRSYSISSRIFDEHGYLTGDAGTGELEFYIVLVPPTDDNIPALTPRLALKRPGDRLYLGPKVAGRYTLAPVTDPRGTVLLFSTGTGEAPHNAMVVELLRKAHRGPIVSVVSVRKWADLGYIDKHRELESMYSNYHYLPMPTRESDVPKRYIQDLIANDTLKDMYGIELDPETTHAFLCGNPAMIGIPKEEDGAVTYPEVTGVIELLAQRGFTMDHRKERGNIHVEEYW